MDGVLAALNSMLLSFAEQEKLLFTVFWKRCRLDEKAQEAYKWDCFDFAYSFFLVC